MLPAIGYALREQNRRILDEPALNGVEITFEKADDPLRVERYIGNKDFDYVSVHALKLSVASPEPPRQAYLDALAAIAEENGAAAVSDHLGFTRDRPSGVDMGHFAYLFGFQGTMSEAEFLTRVLERTGCGWLLDVTNVYANAQNHGYDGYEFIRELMPVAPSVQMHLAGGFFHPTAQKYIDSHSYPVPDDVWDLYRYALEQGRGKVEAVFIERDQNFPDEAGWRGEVRRARQIAEQVGAQQ
jgi:uncharacterized protein (UPF0276 family)